MTEKELFNQLKSLKSIALSPEDKKKNRDVLFSQISNTFLETKNSNNLWINTKNIFSFIYKPALTVAGVFVFLTGVLFLGSSLFEKTKPTNSLYIARILSEKARLNATFDETERDALSLQFASNHAQDIATVLMDPEFNTEENKKAVERLNASFENEISKVQNQIDKTVNTIKSVDPSESDVSLSSSGLVETSGTEIYINEDDSNIKPISSDVTTEPNVNTSSDVNIEALAEQINDSSDKLAKIENGQKILDEIKALFAEGKYSEVVEKLNEIKNLAD
ncbi:MAG TPA: hypothetical protein PLE28_02665 [bacterium]|nr:hypothetical protein [bacterium]